VFVLPLELKIEGLQSAQNEAGDEMPIYYFPRAIAAGLSVAALFTFLRLRKDLSQFTLNLGLELRLTKRSYSRPLGDARWDL
jgi:hypothetical protein